LKIKPEKINYNVQKPARLKSLLMSEITQSSIYQVFTQQQKTARFWRTSTADERIARIQQLQNWILQHQDAIRKAIYADFQKPETETDLSTKDFKCKF
jgi:acyl-CoA reductase-like NAD-dependent aldehyde dehydrogenase